MSRAQHATTVLIAGTGPVGAALAILIAASGYSVCLIGKHDTGSADTRGIALTADVRRILATAGVWNRLDRARMGHVRYIDVQDAAGNSVHFSGPDAGLTALAHVVPYDLLMQTLQERLQEEGRITRHPGLAVRVDMTTDAIQVELSEGAACAGALLVGADGVASRIRALAGIASEHQALDDLALTAVLKTTEPHRDHAWQRFWPDGPLALLPLGGAYTRSLIWSAPAATVQKLLALPEPAFEEELARRAPAFGDFHLCSPRQTFPLGLGQAHRYIGTRVALVGDAAHQMHPLAGQGMNLGLEDAAALAATLADRRYGMDPGDHRRLRHYERWRKAANTPMLQGVEWLRRLFGARHPALVAVRTFGLHLTEHQPWLKRQLIYQAAGLHEDRPETGRSSSAARGGPLKPY